MNEAKFRSGSTEFGTVKCQRAGGKSCADKDEMERPETRGICRKITNPIIIVCMLSQVKFMYMAHILGPDRYGIFGADADADIRE